MNDKEILKMREDIRTGLAQGIYRDFINLKKEIISKSRQNKGGSVTVPKSLIDKWQESFEKDFFELEKDCQSQYYDKADALISIMKLIMKI